MELKNKVIVVTGGLGSLGRAVTEEAAKRGATVVAVDVVDGTPAAGVESCVAADLGDAAATATAFAGIAAKHGRIDAVVNIAGGFVWETIADGSIDSFDRMYQMNVRTAVNASKAALPHFPASGGRIVSISAIGSLKGEFGNAAYSASKAGVSRFTESLAAELKPRNITVNAVMLKPRNITVNAVMPKYR